MARRKQYRYGIFDVTGREVGDNQGYFDDLTKAHTELAKLRDAEKAAGRDPYNIAVLPCGPKNEGLLPP